MVRFTIDEVENLSYEQQFDILCMIDEEVLKNYLCSNLEEKDVSHWYREYREECRQEEINNFGHGSMFANDGDEYLFDRVIMKGGSL